MIIDDQGANLLLCFSQGHAIRKKLESKDKILKNGFHIFMVAICNNDLIINDEDCSTS